MELTKELKELGVATVPSDSVALWSDLLSGVRRASSSTLFFLFLPDVNSVMAKQPPIIRQKHVFG